MEWTIGTTWDSRTGCNGLTIRRIGGGDRRDPLWVEWPRDASAAQIANELERLAIDLRAQNKDPA